MKINFLLPGCTLKRCVAITCALLLLPGNAPTFARQAQQPAEQVVKIPSDQLDALVAPIAIYPDNLLSQLLVASTYPLELVQLEQWLEKNKGLDQKAVVAAVSKQPWDPSIQAMAALPDVVKRLTDDIQWTTDLGNAVLAQQSDVMDAIQRMRAKAQGKGALMSNEQQKVETKVVENKDVIVIEQADPQVVYVPSYDPVAVYGAPVYPYPSIYYPPYYGTGAAVAASAISFGVGVAMGAAWGGGWGFGFGWGGGDIDMNINNNFNRNANISGGNRAAGARNTWQHNPQHRGGAPYSDRATANRFGSNARGDSLASRQKGAQQQIARQKGNLGSAGAGGLGGRQGGGNLGGGGISDRGGISGGGRSGGDRVGNRSVGSGSSVGNRSGFGGGSGGYSGSAARSSSSRGSSSMRSSGRSGGFSGGGRSGGGRAGGGASRGGGRR
jgi:uncharacterized protein DUF3300